MILKQITERMLVNPSNLRKLLMNKILITEANRLAKLELYTAMKKAGLKISHVKISDIISARNILVKEHREYKIQAFINLTKLGKL